MHHSLKEMYFENPLKEPIPSLWDILDREPTDRNKVINVTQRSNAEVSV